MVATYQVVGSVTNDGLSGAVRDSLLIVESSRAWELARQVHTQFLRLGSYTRLSAAVITGGERKSHQVASLRKNPEILVATPGRLLEHLGDAPGDKRWNGSAYYRQHHADAS